MKRIIISLCSIVLIYTTTQAQYYGHTSIVAIGGVATMKSKPMERWVKDINLLNSGVVKENASIKGNYMAYGGGILRTFNEYWGSYEATALFSKHSAKFVAVNNASTMYSINSLSVRALFKFNKNHRAFYITPIGGLYFSLDNIEIKTEGVNLTTAFTNFQPSSTSRNELGMLAIGGAQVGTKMNNTVSVFARGLYQLNIMQTAGQSKLYQNMITYEGGIAVQFYRNKKGARPKN